MVLSRLYHAFPGIDLIETPDWILATLARTLPMIQAEQMARLGQTIRMAVWGNKSEWSRFYSRLQRASMPKQKNPPAIIEAQYADWFEMNDLPYQVIEDTWEL